MSFPNKEKRQSCWSARDQYWKCLEQKAPTHSTTSGAEEPSFCRDLRKLFDAECPAQWVKHFDRKHSYEQFKKKMEAGEDPLLEEK